MSLLQHIRCAIENKTDVVEKQDENSVKNSFLEFIFRRQIFKSNFLFDDSRKFAEVPFSPKRIEYSPLNNPVKFIQKYVNKDTIDYAIECNINIKRILEENNLSIEYNIANVTSIILSHLIPTAKTAEKIYLKMGHKKSEESYLYLVQAALLHDIGKIFIPSEILNKAGKLTSRERIIIELHNKLSYEILKTTDLNIRVAKLAYEHHDYDSCVARNPENQVLTIADIFCALKEKRSYKKPINDICAKAILYDMGTKGKFDTQYINYLMT